MSWARAGWVWLGIIVAETLLGALRRLWLVPMVGERAAHQLGVAIGSLAILAIALASIRWIGARSVDQQWRVGLLWVVQTLIFEFGLGALLGVSASRMLADYDPTRGGLMLAGLAVMLAAPSIAARLRSV